MFVNQLLLHYKLHQNIILRLIVNYSYIKCTKCSTVLGQIEMTWTLMELYVIYKFEMYLECQVQPSQLSIKEKNSKLRT